MNKYVIRIVIKQDILYIGNKDALVFDAIKARIYTYYDALKEAEQWKKFKHTLVNIIPFEKVIK